MKYLVSVPVVHNHSVWVEADSEERAIIEVSMMTPGEVVDASEGAEGGRVLLMDEVEVIGTDEEAPDANAFEN